MIRQARKPAAVVMDRIRYLLDQVEDATAIAEIRLPVHQFEAFKSLWPMADGLLDAGWTLKFKSIPVKEDDSIEDMTLLLG